MSYTGNNSYYFRYNRNEKGHMTYFVPKCRNCYHNYLNTVLYCFIATLVNNLLVIYLFNSSNFYYYLYSTLIGDSSFEIQIGTSKKKFFCVMVIGGNFAKLERLFIILMSLIFLF